MYCGLPFGEHTAEQLRWVLHLRTTIGGLDSLATVSLPIRSCIVLCFAARKRVQRLCQVSSCTAEEYARILHDPVLLAACQGDKLSVFGALGMQFCNTTLCFLMSCFDFGCVMCRAKAAVA